MALFVANSARGVLGGKKWARGSDRNIKAAGPFAGDILRLQESMSPIFVSH